MSNIENFKTRINDPKYTKNLLDEMIHYKILEKNNDKFHFTEKFHKITKVHHLKGKSIKKITYDSLEEFLPLANKDAKFEYWFFICVLMFNLDLGK